MIFCGWMKCEKKQSQWCQQYMDSEELYKFVVIIDQPHVCTATSVETFDFSTLNTSISQSQLKSRINNLQHNAFRKKDR